MSKRDIIRVCGLVSAIAASAPLSIARAEPVQGAANNKLAACPTQAQLVDRVERQLGRALGVADPTLRIDTKLEQTSTGYALTVRTRHEDEASERDEQGVRSFEGASCSELADAAALLLALSIGAQTRARPLVEASEREAALASTRAERVPSQRALRGSLRAAGLLDVGYLPRPGVGAELGAGLSFARSRVELSGLFLPGVRSDARAPSPACAMSAAAAL